MATSDDLRQIFTAGRPLIEEWLDIGEQIAALRDVAASKGLDWSQLKALMKAQVQDERDETGNGKRVARIVEKAEFASAYADMLGLANMNENNFSASQSYSEAKGRGDVGIPITETETNSNPVANVGEGANGAIAAASNYPASRDVDGADRQQPAMSGFTGEDDGRDVEASGGAASVITNPDQGRNGPLIPVEASTDKQAAGSSRPTNSNSQASPPPADSAGGAPSSSPASPARHSDDIDLTIPDFLRRTEGGYPKREAVDA